jgi:hypothetical protein
MNPTLQKFLGFVISVVLIAGMIYARIQLSANFDYQNSNFAFFWLSGKMILDGENPYDETTYLANHDKYGIKWQPNQIFPYPLPLAIVCIPLGFFSMGTAYILWQIVSLIFVAITITILLNQWQNISIKRLLIPIFLAMLFFGPEYLTLYTGTIGAFTLLLLAIAVLLLEKEKFILAGILLAFTMLKPPQGLTILLLAGIWFLTKRNWKAIIGVAIGGVLLLVIGLLQDPQWLQKFLGASNAVMDRTQGVHSNVWAFAYLACKGASPCSTLLGGTLALILLGLGGFYLWKNQVQVTAWEAFNVIIPIAFVSTIYLWAYDQLPYIIPIVWIVGTLVERTKSYILAFVFLIVLDIFSFYALVQQAGTDKDLWSLGTTIIVLGTVLGLMYLNQNKPIQTTSRQI